MGIDVIKTNDEYVKQIADKLFSAVRKIIERIKKYIRPIIEAIIKVIKQNKYLLIASKSKSGRIRKKNLKRFRDLMGG
ncbi:MAG: hypothetical protein RSA49_05140 [Anaerovoracaceae bacterium]